ncbi:NAD-dependent epimerase/dehydratase family protein [Bradyrhizobium sp. CB1015]|uniref:NAD-dependent epimerase/dehydratase family protein n=1 Tax=Bradyrhizobium sp. CB1015 TaxID=2976822 RepID=UPI0021AA7B6C|nr:NAD-dependent epimerase/dehydratase family protein [Bradyrhizobium sp. CB1015]UWU89967.1 NAD-dependent epimerase/dehydratase family protein [Bradyrhizobium sp. CB1015]
MNPILDEDLHYVLNQLSPANKSSFQDGTILITGCAGFLGFSFMHFFSEHARALGIRKIIGLDTFLLAKPKWISEITIRHPGLVDVHQFDISKDDISSIDGGDQATHVIHGASIASPVFYRKFPIVTLDANIWGLRRILDFHASKKLRGLLFFSSSEIYGDPSADNIPTDEEYRGNVSCIGPRACYDESKRFGETMCYLFSKEHGIPITIARPFNNYGPGMRTDDRRVPADFAKCVIENRNIEILSSGSPTRTFCYVADAITGYLKCLTYGEFDYFNIGIEKPEISVRELASLYQEAGARLGGYRGMIVLGQSSDKEYLTHNPNRRCPNIKKARTKLGYDPAIDVRTGIERFVQYLLHEKEKGALA